ncbi:MAG: GWxTD domain-containing protein [Rhodothermaceae bacterium]|nr:GWxTD domain-containing protein [Rhodothermaceae bacterium]
MLSVLWIGCSSPSALDSPDAGRSMTYEPGLPNFDLEALATLRSGAPGLDLYLSVPHASLVFTNAGGAFRAQYRYDVEVRDERGQARTHSVSFVDSLRLPTYAATRTFRPVVREERLAVDPGTYVVVATLTDEETDKTVERRQRVTVPVPVGAPAISRVALAIKRPGEAFEPQVALNTPTGFDSLRATIELYNTTPTTSVQLQLERLRSDTTVARPAYWLAYGRSSLEFRGVDFSGAPADTIQVTTRPVEQAALALSVEINLPPLEPGVYRIHLTARDSSGTEPFAEQTREFAVRQADFPRLTELGDLIAALTYLTSERELTFIQEGETAGERRRRFDGFWGTLFNDRRVASGIVRLYYERVEEANLLFTTHKEGWRTDRGMVYVLLGPPAFVETMPTDERWHYQVGGSNTLSTFVFERASYYEGVLRPAFENWVLQRSNAYEPIWRRAIRNWREGTVL